MSDNINKLMILEQQIIKFIDENDIDDPSIDDKFDNTHYIDKCISILKKMSNEDIIEAIKRFDYIPLFVDYKVFLKKYRVNEKELKENPELCLIEYDKINDVCKRIDEICNNKKDYMKYIDILDLDHVFETILKLMPNNDLNTLALRSNDWTDKLYYYSFLKNED